MAASRKISLQGDFMKKIASFLAFLALGISVSAKSWTNYAGFGWRIPTAVKVQSDDSNGKDIKFKTQTGLSLDYAGVHENGFSLRGIFDINYSGSDIEVGSDKDEMEGANCLFLVGAGYAPIHTEKMFLGFYGMLGADATVLNYEETVSVGGYSNSYEVTVSHAATVLGANATFVYSPAEHFSLFASVCANYMFPAQIKIDEDIKINGVSKSESPKYDCKGAFKFVPTVGICWRF